MTISAYQIDNVIKAYSKQSKMRLYAGPTRASSSERYLDVVSLSGPGGGSASGGGDFSKQDVYKKNAYSLADVMARRKE